MTTGERLPQNRRLRVPASGEWVDGRFIDAGLAHILSNNLAHAQRESVRRWCASLGPGSITNGERGYTRSGTRLDDRPDPGAYADISMISWDLRTAQRLGPFALIRDREVSGQPLAWRRVRVSVDATGAALTLLVALCDPRSIPDSSRFAFAALSITSGRGVYSVDLDPVRSVPEQGVTCRRPDSSDTESSHVAPVSLWVGWYSTSGTSAIYSITAGEIR